MSTTEYNDIKRYENDENPNILNNMILVGLVFVGLIIKLFFGFKGNSNNGPASSLIWGYSIVIFSLLGLSFTILSVPDIPSKSQKSILGISKVFINFMPIILLLVGLTWLINLNINHYDLINLGDISNTYYNYSHITTLLIIIQIIIIIQFIISYGKSSKQLLKEFANNFYYNTTGDTTINELLSRINKINSSYTLYILWLLVIITLVFIGMQDVILRYFTTDG
tara:strand:+ start:1656 stop:2327 length:672 start_codon:yes stop_codon:yes gene_type:complete